MSEHPRSAFSRFYYAAYSACCGWLEKWSVPKQATDDGELWYSHKQMKSNLGLAAAGEFGEEPRMSDDGVRDLARQVQNLCDARVHADYWPQVPLSERFDVSWAQTAAQMVLQTLGVIGEE